MPQRGCGRVRRKWKLSYQSGRRIGDEDTLDQIKKRGLDLEWQLYPECVQLFAQGRLELVKMTHTLDNNKSYNAMWLKF